MENRILISEEPLNRSSVKSRPHKDSLNFFLIFLFGCALGAILVFGITRITSDQQSRLSRARRDLPSTTAEPPECEADTDPQNPKLSICRKSLCNARLREQKSKSETARLEARIAELEASKQELESSVANLTDGNFNCSQVNLTISTPQTTTTKPTSTSTAISTISPPLKREQEPCEDERKVLEEQLKSCEALKNATASKLNQFELAKLSDKSEIEQLNFKLENITAEVLKAKDHSDQRQAALDRCQEERPQPESEETGNNDFNCTEELHALNRTSMDRYFYLKQCEEEKEQLQIKLDNLMPLGYNGNLSRRNQEPVNCAQEKRSSSNSIFSMNPLESGKCPPGWSYLRKTEKCYYIHNFDFDELGALKTYSWRHAEKKCQQIGAHLVSVQARGEIDFLRQFAMTNVRAFNPRVDRKNPCAGSYYGAWIGLRYIDEEAEWTDGSEVLGSFDDPVDVEYAMCSDVSQGDTTDLFYPIPVADRARLARFICKKAALEEN